MDRDREPGKDIRDEVGGRKEAYFRYVQCIILFVSRIFLKNINASLFLATSVNCK